MRTIALAAFLAFSAPAAAQGYLSGPAHAGDGDSLTISGISVRLYGIDAPELGQFCRRGGVPWKCGEEAKRQLQAMVEGQQVSCRRIETDEYGRTIAVCTAGRRELNKAMVESGWATAFRRYSDAYIADEMHARTAGLGIWSSEFETPADYRHRNQRRQAIVTRPPEPVTARQSPSLPRSGCLIKGNHSRKGEWIYHLPGMPYYDQTRAEEMFCTEADAQAAGYRKSQAHN
jgi:endonuclease YncB( thermonuclease family)